MRFVGHTSSQNIKNIMYHAFFALSFFFLSIGGLHENAEGARALSKDSTPHPHTIFTKNQEGWSIGFYLKQPPQCRIQRLDTGKWVLQWQKQDPRMHKLLKKLQKSLTSSLKIQKNKTGTWTIQTTEPMDLSLQRQKNALIVHFRSLTPPEPPSSVDPKEKTEPPPPEPPPLLQTLCHWNTQGQHTLLEISPPQPGGLAVYERSGYHWVVLDAAYPVHLPPLPSNTVGLRDISFLPIGPLVFFRIILDPLYTLEPTLVSGAWQLMVMPYRIERPDRPYEWAKNLQRTTMELPLLDAVAHVFKDPVIHDSCVVFVSQSPKAYQPQPFSCAAFEELETAQGYVMVLKDQDILIQKSRDTIKIQHSYGSPSAQYEEGHSRAPYPLVIAFPSEPLQGHLWSQARDQKQKEVIQTSGVTKQRARLDLALFYLTTFHYVESLSELRTLESEAPLILIDPRFRAIRGATLYFMNRYEESLEDFSVSALQHVPETLAWRDMCYAQINPHDAPRIPWGNIQTQMKEYPRYALEKIAFAGAQHAHQRTQYKIIKPFLDLLDNTYDPSHKALYNDLMGYHAFYDKRYAQAFEFWQTLAEATPVPYQGLAQVADVMRQWNGYQTHPQEAIQLLEATRPFLQNEPLMRAVQETLAQLYEQASLYPEALALWQKLEKTYGPHAYRDKICHSLDKLLQDQELFQKNPLKVIGLFESSTKYISLQESYGRTLMMSGIQCLESLSLFERATTLLTELISQTTDSSSRLPYAIELAELFLKRGMHDEAFDYAQQCLEYEQGLTAQDREKIFLIQVHALKAQGKTEKAETLLKSQSSPALSHALATLYLEQERWEEAFNTYHQTLTQTPAEPQNPLWQHHVLNMALSAFYLKDTQKRQWVSQTFKGLLKATESEERFRLLTEDSDEHPLHPQLLTLP